jgi:transcriptional regulator with XRE-family HTH domain
MLAEGFSQADLARELGVTRQAIQACALIEHFPSWASRATADVAPPVA